MAPPTDGKINPLMFDIRFKKFMSKNRDHFRTYVINMDSATDRMAHMQQQLNTLGISFKRMPGVVGANLKHPHPDFSDWSYKYLHGRLWTPAEVGCYLSHIECLKDFITSDADYALILEDDVTISSDIKKTIQAALKYKQSWNMLRLSTVNSGKWFTVKSLGNRNLAICLTREKGAGGYLVDRKAASQMIDKLLPMRFAWDIAFDFEWFLAFKTLGVFPFPISQRSKFDTQIQKSLKKIKNPFKYVSVFPTRTLIEVSRLVYRTSRLVLLSVLSPLPYSTEVVITNMKKRLSGVTGTINTLLPVQAENINIGFMGSDIPGAKIAADLHPGKFSKLTFWEAIRLSISRLSSNKKRIWHVRRDPEMMLAVFLRDFLRFPISIVFTSAAKYMHSWFPKWLISKMDAVIATTAEAASFVSNTTAVIPHGTSIERFSPPSDKSTAWGKTGLPGKYGIGTFGRVRPDKGTDIFVDAMLELLPRYPEFTAVIAGYCHPRDQQFQIDLMNKISNAGLYDRIIFLGEVPLEKMSFWYQSVLIAVACPRHEEYGITPLEAMACCCAVIASDTGAFREIIDHNITGQLVPTHQTEPLVDALRYYTENVKLAINTGNLGRKRVEQFFSAVREGEKISIVYQNLS